MCQRCVTEGILTQAQLDERILAGDRSVLSYADRSAVESPEDLLQELLSLMTPEQVIAFHLMTTEEQISFLSGKGAPRDFPR